MLSLRAFNAATCPRVFASRRNAVPPRAVGTMASSREGAKLDKSTSDSVWKEILSAEEVSHSCGKGLVSVLEALGRSN